MLWRLWLERARPRIVGLLSCRPLCTVGVAESEINAFLNLMTKDHVHPKAAEHLRKGKCTIERYLAIIDLSVAFLALHCRMAHIPSNGKRSWVCWGWHGCR